MEVGCYYTGDNIGYMQVGGMIKLQPGQTTWAKLAVCPDTTIGPLSNNGLQKLCLVCEAFCDERHSTHVKYYYYICKMKFLREKAQNTPITIKQ